MWVGDYVHEKTLCLISHSERDFTLHLQEELLQTRQIITNANRDMENQGPSYVRHNIAENNLAQNVRQNLHDPDVNDWCMRIHQK